MAWNCRHHLHFRMPTEHELGMKRARLKQAVRQERYEEAARLRDQLELMELVRHSFKMETFLKELGIGLSPIVGIR